MVDSDCRTWSERVGWALGLGFGVVTVLVIIDIHYIYDVIMKSLILVLLALHWRIADAVENSVCRGFNNSDASSDENLTVWNVTVVTQLELSRFIENVTTYTKRCNTTNCLYLSLTGGSNYELDIVNIMKLSINGSLMIESKGGLSEINCTTASSDLEELSQTVQPLSRASLVLLDGLIFTGCPVPILIEEASNVFIQNCVFR